jgi:hypothetical protein
MALQKVLMSFTIEDAKGYKGSLPIYGTYDDATATLASVLAYIDTMATLVDAITEGKVISQSLVLYPTLGAGLKADPVANSDVQESGLFTFPMANLPSKSFSIDVPALIQAAFVADNINTANVAIAAWLDEINNNTAEIRATNDIWTTFLNPVRKAVKSFRKFGKR